MRDRPLVAGLVGKGPLPICRLQGLIEMGDTGLEHSPLAASESPISKGGGAKSDARNAPDAVQDPDLAKIVEAWPDLPEHIKAAIKTLVQTCDKGVEWRRQQQ